MSTFITIMTNAVLVLAFLTVLGLVGVFASRFLTGTEADRPEH